MARYLISFKNGAMVIPEEDMPDVSKAADAVVQETKDAGVFVFGGGLPPTRNTTWWLPTGRSPMARTRKAKSSSAASSSSMCPRARKRWRGPPRSPSPAAVRKKSGSSCPTRPSDRRRSRSCSPARARGRATGRSRCSRSCAGELHRRPGGDHPDPPRRVGAGGRPDKAVR